MKYCGCGYGCGCQNSCGYPRMRIRMRSSDTPLVTTITDHSESKSKQFASVTKIVDKPSLAHLGLVSHPIRPYTLAICRPSRFLHSLKQDTAPSAVPFFICQQDNVSDPAEALSFASAPKFSRDCHKLPDLLSQHTKELPDSLRTKDFEARSHHQGLIFSHESARCSSAISDEELKRSSSCDSRMAMAFRSSERISPTPPFPFCKP